MLKRALLDLSNAEARYRLGSSSCWRQSPQSALPWLESAARLDPHAGRYWTDLAIVQASLGESDSEQRSLQHALEVDSHTPEIAWDAANLYLALGAIDQAMKEFHVVFENDATLTWPALRTCWKIRPDVGAC
jgi:tetratricopeptide (TPR) repeat protein